MKRWLYGLRLAGPVLLGLCAAAFAQPNPNLVIPATSGLKLVEAVKASVPAAGPSPAAGGPNPHFAFRGSVTVHGTLLAQWLPNLSGDGSAGRSYRLLLSAESAAHLPHFQGLPLEHIEVSNGDLVLTRATSKAIAKQFKARKRAVVQVQGLFTLQMFSLGGACRNAASASLGQVDPFDVRFEPPGERLNCKT